MINKVILLGRVGNDIELKRTSNDTAVANISVATDEFRKTQAGKQQVLEKHTEWHRVVVFGALAEMCAEHLKKGRLVYVEGKLRTRNYEDRNGNRKYITEVHAETIRFLDSKKADFDAQNDDDDLPF